jgi:Fic family protein
MLSQGYWLAEYISISRVLHKAHAQYSRSFLFTKIDDNDLTYFISYHLSVIRRAISDLQQYLERKINEVRHTESLLRKTAHFNHRQLALLSHALRRPETRFTIESHRRSHAVVYDTARTDLLELSDRGLLAKRKRGRTYEFVTPSDLAKRLADLDGGP